MVFVLSESVSFQFCCLSLKVLFCCHQLGKAHIGSASPLLLCTDRLKFLGCSRRVHCLPLHGAFLIRFVTNTLIYAILLGARFRRVHYLPRCSRSLKHSLTGPLSRLHSAFEEGAANLRSSSLAVPALSTREVWCVSIRLV